MPSPIYNTLSFSVDCKLSEWGSWSSTCSCDERFSIRKKIVLRSEQYGGEPCPDEPELRRCEPTGCNGLNAIFGISIGLTLSLVSATIVLSSTAQAAERHGVGDRLGEYVEAGELGKRPFFVQRDTEGSKPHYLYFEDSCWQVSETLGNRNDYIKNCQDTQLPPTTNWEYVRGGGGWTDDDTSLTLEFTSLSPCKLVRVAGEGDVVER